MLAVPSVWVLAYISYASRLVGVVGSEGRGGWEERNKPLMDGGKTLVASHARLM